MSTEGRPTRHILVVDDEGAIRKALQWSLARAGYHVAVAESPAEGLEYLKRNPVDLVISDHLMPEMTGLEFLSLIRDRHPDCLRMMLTAHADAQTAIDAINQGEVCRLLLKPWDDAELKVVLHMAFEKLDLERQNRRLLALVRRQGERLMALEDSHPGIAQVRRDHDGAILLDGPSA